MDRIEERKLINKKLKHIFNKKDTGSSVEVKENARCKKMIEKQRKLLKKLETVSPENQYKLQKRFN